MDPLGAIRSTFPEGFATFSRCNEQGALGETRSAFAEGFATFSRCNKQGAVELFSQHLQQFPHDFECLMYRGASYEFLGHQSAAVNDYSEAEKWGTPCEKIVVSGLRMRVQGQKEEASNAFRLAKETYAREGIAWHFYGIDRMRSDAKEEAQEAFERALAADYRRSCVSCYFLGQLHAAKGNHAAAIKFYRDSLKANPETTICHIGLGDSLFETGSLAEAKERYETAIRLNPAQVQANLGLARILIREDQSDEAVQHFMKWADPSTLLSMSSSSDGGRAGAGSSGGGSGGDGDGSSSGSGGKKQGKNVGNRGLHTSTTGKKPWKIPDDQILKIAEHPYVGKLFQWKKDDRLWFAVDRARHGGAKYKAFRDTGNKLVFLCSVDEYGHFMENKHESNARSEKQRLTIPKNQLSYKNYKGRKE